MSKWDGIEEFVGVANAQSFVGAARQLGVSGAHVSRSIARIEARLGVRLFDRTTRSLSLTHAGQTLFPAAQKLCLERDAALAQISPTSELKGDIRISCSAAIGHEYMLPVIKAFAQDFPDLSVHVELTNRRVDLVKERYDLAIRAGALPESTLIATKIKEREWVTCASRGYLHDKGEPGLPSELSDHDCVIGTSPLWYFHDYGNLVTVRPKGRWRCNSGEGVMLAVQADMGICQLPLQYVKDALLRGELKTVLVDFNIAPEPIWAVYPDKRYVPSAIRQLIDRLKA